MTCGHVTCNQYHTRYTFVDENVQCGRYLGSYRIWMRMTFFHPPKGIEYQLLCSLSPFQEVLSTIISHCPMLIMISIHIHNICTIRWLVWLYYKQRTKWQFNMDEIMQSAIPIIFLNIIWGFLVSIQLPFFPIEVRTIIGLGKEQSSIHYLCLALL